MNKAQNRVKQSIFLVLLLVAGCQPTKTVVLESATEPVHTATQPEIKDSMPTATPGYLSTSTPHASGSPTVTESSNQIDIKVDFGQLKSEIENAGVLVAHVEGSKEFLILNFKDETVTSRITRTECGDFLLPNSTELLCRDDSQVFLLDLLTQEETPLPISSPDWISASTNGRFLYYGYVKNDQETQNIFTYDLLNGVEQVFAAGVNIEGWLNPFSPIFDGGVSLSYDGISMALIEYVQGVGDRIFQYTEPGKARAEIGPDGKSALGGPIWSPTSPSLLFGITEVGFEVEPLTSALYRYNRDSDQSEMLIEAPENSYFYTDWISSAWLQHSMPAEVWSPDGEKIIAITDQAVEVNGDNTVQRELCVLSLSTTDHACQIIDYQQYFWIDSVTWSPAGDAVAFMAGFQSRGDLIVYSIQSQSFYVLATQQPIDGLYWR